MGLQGIRRLLALGVFAVLLCGARGPVAASAPDQLYAATGAVYTTPKTPVGNVTVVVFTKYGSEVTKTTTNGDGKYLLKIPNPPQQYMIHFQHEDYLEDIRGYFENKIDQIFEDVMMVPAKIGGQLNAEQMNKLIDRFAAYEAYGRGNSIQVYKDVAVRNLLKLEKYYSPTDAAGIQVKNRLNSELTRMSGSSPSSRNPYGVTERLKKQTTDRPSSDATRPKSPTPAPQILVEKGRPPLP